MKVLDIGCGWGKIAEYVAQKTKAEVYGLTISQEQYDYMRKHTSVVPILGHYKDIPKLTNHQQFDAIYSIGIFEHVTYENGPIFFSSVKQSLKPNGIFVMHTITSSQLSKPTNYKGDSFVIKHIFPGGQIADVPWIYQFIRDSKMSMAHHEVFGGQHYAETLKHWRANLLDAREVLKARGYSESILLAYEYYFAACEGSFRANALGLSHFVIQNTPLAYVDQTNFLHDL